MSYAGKRAVRRRPAFTLIEMLVVLAIIAVLASLTAAAVFRMIGSQQSTNTKAELSKLEGEFVEGVPRRGGQISPRSRSPTTGQPDGQRLLQHGPADGRQRPRPRPRSSGRNSAQADVPNDLRRGAQSVADAAASAPTRVQLNQLGYTTTTRQLRSRGSRRPAAHGATARHGRQRRQDGRPRRQQQLSMIPDAQRDESRDWWTAGATARLCRWPCPAAPNLEPQRPAARRQQATTPATPRVAGLAHLARHTAATAWFTTQILPPGAGNIGRYEATTYRIYPLIASAGQDGVLGWTRSRCRRVSAADARRSAVSLTSSPRRRPSRAASPPTTCTRPAPNQ